MNPRLVEPGFVAACLHVDGPARPGQDENGEDEAQQSRRHGRKDDTGTRGAAQARGSFSSRSSQPLPHEAVGSSLRSSAREALGQPSPRWRAAV
jgi:hypothetical protein